MKHVLMLYDVFAGQVLLVRDETAAVAEADGWGLDLDSHPYPYDSSGVIPGMVPTTASYVRWRYFHTAMQVPYDFTSISNTNPAVVTVPAAVIGNLNNGNAVLFEDTGTPLDNWFAEGWVNVQNKDAANNTFEVGIDLSGEAAEITSGTMYKLQQMPVT